MTETAPRFAPGTFTPAPGRGNTGRMLVTYARIETLLTLRHGEQILLTLLIPLALLVGLTVLDVIPMGELTTASGDRVSKVDWVTPRILSLAVMSSAFTGQAISLGFDRRYGALKRLSATALPRWTLVTGRIMSALVVVVVQVLALGGIAALLGWQPRLAALPMAVLLLVVGTVSFGALGVLLGGALRAEIVLALANIVWFVLLGAGGILLAPTALPDALAVVVRLLPSGALAEGLRAVFVDGTTAWSQLGVLAVWGVGAAALATRTTKLS